ncbi:uncharacterized protein LOC117788019 [Drosophila innubila]|uniref:uncharacterized protein LOC117788019 n=1 Tax=Drosophila innubila TaxID=198719 RepID=UPI00148BA14A|nr:uncharacterized protein LOC117788019 [Drosophila innubila]
MKQFLLLCLVFAALFAANASVLPAANQHGEMVWQDEVFNPVRDKCIFSCTNQGLSVCAYNGQCLQLFTSRCKMSAYNCRNPQKRFDIVENYRCTQGHVPLCSKA